MMKYTSSHPSKRGYTESSSSTDSTTQIILKDPNTCAFYATHSYLDPEVINRWMIQFLSNAIEHDRVEQNKLARRRKEDGNDDESGKNSISESTAWVQGIIRELQDLRGIMKGVTESVEGTVRTTVDGTVDKSIQLHLQSSIGNVVRCSEERINSRIVSLRDTQDSQMERLKDANRQSQNIQQELKGNVMDLLRKMDNSSTKGKISENILSGILHQLYPSAEVEAVGAMSIKESGDFILKRNNRPKILIENKHYNRNVAHDEVKKFLRDVETQKCCGVFLAQKHGVANKENFEINLHEGKIVLFVHEVNNDLEKIRLAIDVVDHLQSVLDQLYQEQKEGYESDADEAVDDPNPPNKKRKKKEQKNGQSDDSNETNNNNDNNNNNNGKKQKKKYWNEDIYIPLNKTLLHEIFLEFQAFASHKSSHLKTIREFTQQLQKETETMQFPSVERLVRMHYSMAQSMEYTCPYCSFVGKNASSLGAHRRKCKERPIITKEKKMDETNEHAVKVEEGTSVGN